MAVAQAAWTAAAVNSSTSVNSITTTTAALNSNSFGIAYVAFDTISGLVTPTITMSDSAGGSWTQIGSYVRPTAAGVGLPSLGIFIRTTLGTGSSMTVTATVSGAGPTYIQYKVLQTQQFSGTAGTYSSVTTSYAAGSTSWPTIVTPTSLAVGDMYLYAAGFNDTSPTTPSGWTVASNPGTTGSNPSMEAVYAYYKAATSVATATTGTGNQSGNSANVSQAGFVLYAGTPITSVESWGFLSIN
jgi:hypothetical protein